MAQLPELKRAFMVDSVYDPLRRAMPQGDRKRRGEPARRNNASDLYRDIPNYDLARVTGAHARSAIATAKELGADLRALSAESGIDDLEGQLPETISVDSYLKFLDGAARHLKNPLFGLQVGLRSRVTDAAAYALVLLACKDLRSVLEQVCRFESLSHDLFRSEVVEVAGVAHLRAHSPWLDRPGGRQLMYAAAAAVRPQAEWLLGILHIDVRSVLQFSATFDEPPARRGDYERVLGAQMRFQADFNEVCFPAVLLDLPIPSADPSLFPALKQVADGRLAARCETNSAPIVSAVRARISDLLMHGNISLPRIAAVLDTPPRTLQRRLAAANVSFSGLLDTVRREQAQHYLQNQSLSLTEIALLLGFSEQSTFNHAFRGWFGTAPSAWRMRAGDSGASCSAPGRSA